MLIVRQNEEEFFVFYLDKINTPTLSKPNMVINRKEIHVDFQGFETWTIWGFNEELNTLFFSELGKRG